MKKEFGNGATLVSLILDIQELLLEIREEQKNIVKNSNKHHSVTMKKLDKLREFDEIADMTYQVFERRISNIENILSKSKTREGL